jgi:hypothetical protein
MRVAEARLELYGFRGWHTGLVATAYHGDASQRGKNCWARVNMDTINRSYLIARVVAARYRAR